MKKILIVLALLITFFIIYFLQINLFNWFTIFKISPNIFIILVLFIGLFAGRWVGASLGIIFGMLLDLISGTAINITGVFLGIIGYAGGYLEQNFSKDSKLTIMLMCIGATFLYELRNLWKHDNI